MESKKESAGSLFQCYLLSFGKFGLVHPVPNIGSYGTKQKLFHCIGRWIKLEFKYYILVLKFQMWCNDMEMKF